MSVWHVWWGLAAVVTALPAFVRFDDSTYLRVIMLALILYMNALLCRPTGSKDRE